MVEGKGNVILLHCKGMKHIIDVPHVLRVTKTCCLWFDQL